MPPNIIAQITIERPALPFAGYDGTLRLYTSTMDDGSLIGTEASVYFYTEIPCPADFDGTHDVDLADYLYLLGQWGPCP